MATQIIVPTGERDKSIQFNAPYSPSQSFNPDKDLFYQMSGVLIGMDITVDTVPDPDTVTVDAGAFIQNGIIVKITASQEVDVPDPATYPLYLVAENNDEISSSDVTIRFTTTPNADSVIIAEWASAPITVYETPQKASIKEILDAIAAISALAVNRDVQFAGAGQTVFTLPAGKEYVPGHNTVWVFRNGKKLDVSADYTETDANTVTMIAPATLSDVYEFMIFQDAQPVAGATLAALSDVTGDLSDAIKDVSVLRANPATASNPLVTKDDLGTINLEDLNDVSSGLSNAVRDTGTLRASPADASNPLATIADTASGLISVSYAARSTDWTVPTTSFAIVPGCTVTIPAQAGDKLDVVAYANLLEDSSNGLIYFRVRITSGTGEDITPRDIQVQADSGSSNDTESVAVLGYDESIDAGLISGGNITVELQCYRTNVSGGSQGRSAGMKVSLMRGI